MIARTYLWLSVIAVAACSAATREHVSGPAKPSLIATVEEQYARSPRDLYLAYYLAKLTARKGDTEQAIRWLTELSRKGWKLGLQRGDFASVMHDERSRELIAALEAAHDKRTRGELAFEVPGSDIVAEGIAYDPGSQQFFVGILNRHQIVAVSRQGEISTFGDPAADIGEVLGLRIDAQQRILWATGHSDQPGGAAQRTFLVALDLTTGRLLRRVELEDAASRRMFNDLCLFDDGTVYVTETIQGAVYQAGPADSAARVFVEDGRLQFPNGIACDPSRNLLYVADAMGVLAVERGSARGERVTVADGSPIGGIDGLYLYNDSLIGVQNGFGAGHVVQIHLDEQGTVARDVAVLESAHARMGIPTTGAVVGDTLFFIANSRLECQGIPASSPCEAPHVAIVSVRLSDPALGE